MSHIMSLGLIKLIPMLKCSVYNKSFGPVAATAQFVMIMGCFICSLTSKGAAIKSNRVGVVGRGGDSECIFACEYRLD